MKKSTLTLLFIAGIAIASFAQIKIGANVGVNIPANGLSGADPGFGGYVNGRYVFARTKAAVGVDLGLYTLGLGTSGSGYSSSYTMMPILASFEYFFTSKGLKPFVGVKAGFVNSTASFSYAGYYSSKSSLDFALGPQAGLAYGVTNNLDLNLTVQYLLIVGSSSVGILPVTVGVTYRFGK